MSVNISSNAHTSTLVRVKELADNLSYLQSCVDGTEVEIQSVGFVTPLAITALAAEINRKSLIFKYGGTNSSYLRTINFPEGVSNVEASPSEGTYFPIIRLNMEGADKTSIARLLSALHTKYLDLLKRNIIADERFMDLITNNTFGFLLGELFDNIEEHSEAKSAYLFTQYWQRMNSSEICLLDDGQGLYGSLKKAGRDVHDDMDALRKVLEKGLSAKHEVGAAVRGTGIKNTRLAITNQEINGEFFIMSGSAAFLHSAKEGSKFITLTRARLNGTMVMLRINEPRTKFNLYNYVR